MTIKKNVLYCFMLTLLFATLIVGPVFADDSVVSRGTLKNLQSVRVIVEDFNPNIQKYAIKSGLENLQLQKDIEQRLRAAGIRVVTANEWLNTAGRPALYININTHETDKYWYAYDIKLEFRQIVFLESNPKIRTLACTWSLNMTGMANIGNLHIIKNDAIVLIDRFINAHHTVNR